MVATSVKQILKAVGNPHLALYRGEGYWYFTYDDVERDLYDTHSVMTMYLNHGPLEDWVDEGRRFCQRMERQTTPTHTKEPTP